jgi:hypothetical protein
VTSNTTVSSISDMCLWATVSHHASGDFDRQTSS